MASDALPPRMVDPEELLRHAERLRGLARHLLRDADLADDVVQDAMLAAVRHPPGAAPLGPWLVAVVRNLALFARRSGARRAARERAAARVEATEATASAVERAESRRHLVAHVLALDEPYRATILLRYLDGLSAAEIARRTDVPSATVRTRVQRGLAALRERLDASHGGDRRAWAIGLAPLAAGVGTTGAGIGAVDGVVEGARAAGRWFAMGTAKKAAVAVAAAVVALLALRQVVGGDGATNGGRGADVAQVGTADAAGRGGRRAAAAMAAGGPAPMQGAASVTGRVAWFDAGDAVAAGRSADDDGAAPGVRVTLSADGKTVVETVTDDAGRFAIASLRAADGYEIRVARPGAASAMPSSTTQSSNAPVSPSPPAPRPLRFALAEREARDVGTLWLAPPCAVAVVVSDRSGAPLEGARVEVFRTGLLPVAADMDWIWERGGRRRLPSDGATRANRVADVRTGADGVVTIDGLTPGVVAVRVSHARGAADVRDRVVVAPPVVVASPIGPDAAPPTLRFVLDPAHTVSGRVEDGQGRPVGGAVLTVLPARGSDDHQVDDAATWRRWTATTDAHGAFALEGLPPESLRVAVRTPASGAGDGSAQDGAAPVRATPAAASDFVLAVIVPPCPEPLVLRLPAAGGTIAGRVTDAAGTPVAGAEVALKVAVPPAAGSGSGRPATVRTTTDDDGRFALVGVPRGGEERFTVRAAGFVPWPGPGDDEPSGLGAVPAATTRTLDARLLRGGAATVRVVDDEGRGVAAARVCLQRLGQYAIDAPEVFAAADAAGVARVSGLAPGRWEVVPDAPGFVASDVPSWWWQMSAFPDVHAEKSTIDVPPDGAADVDVTVRITRGATVAGRVSDDAGRPVGGALVAVTGAAGARPVVSDAEGRFRAAGVPSSARVVATATAEGFADGRSAPFAVPASGAVADVAIVLRAGGTVTGVVRRADGRAATGVIVRVRGASLEAPESDRRPSPGDFDGEDRHPVDADGRFAVAGVAPGFADVVAECDGCAPGFAMRIAVAAGGASAPAEIVLVPLQAFRVRVVGPDGAPVAGATVCVDPWPGDALREGATDADGRFASDLSPGDGLRLSVSAAGFVPVERDVEPDVARVEGAGAGIEIRLAVAREIRGVVRGEDGAPVVGAEVRASSDEWEDAAATGPDGTFVLAGVASERIDLDVDPGRASDLVATRVEGVAAPSRDVVVTLARGGAIAGRAVDPDGRPAWEGEIRVRREDDDDPAAWNRWASSVYVRPDGTFRIGGLPEGRWTLDFGDSARGSAHAEGVATGATDVVLHVERGRRSVVLTVLDADGVGVPRCGQLRLGRRNSPGDAPTSVWVLGDGRVIVWDVAPGAYAVTLSADGHARVRIEGVDLTGREATVRLSRGRVLAGRVVDATGRPLPGLRVSVEPRAGGAHAPGAGTSAPTDVAGAFRIDGLGDGPWRVIVRSRTTVVAVVDAVREVTTTFEVRVPDASSVAGRVVDADGAPVAGAVVSLVLDDGPGVGTKSSAADGTFEFSPVPGGRTWRVVAHRMGPDRKPGAPAEAAAVSGARDVTLRLPDDR